MNLKKFVTLILCILIIVTLAQCKNVIHYQLSTSMPKAVFIDNQVHNIPMANDIYKDKTIFIEITKRDGRRDKGKLIEISHEGIVLAESYYYSELDDSTRVKIDNIVTIPKDAILIMKVW